MICLETAKRYCKNYTEIENYNEAISDKSELWIPHHIMEEVFTHKELKNAGWYYNRPASELIFIRESEHNGNAKLHIGLRRKNANQKGKPFSEEHKQKISEGHKGKKREPFSEEWKQKMSEAKKGNSYRPKRYIRCIETGEVRYIREWRRLGYDSARKVASGKLKSCKGLRFEFVD